MLGDLTILKSSNDLDDSQRGVVGGKEDFVPQNKVSTRVIKTAGEVFHVARMGARIQKLFLRAIA